MMQEFLVEKVIPSSAVYYDSLSYDTWSNISEEKKIKQQNGWENAVAISSPMHLLRIKKMAKKQGLRLFYSTFWEKYIKTHSYFSIWLDIQHELMAWVACVILPHKLYCNVVLYLRTVN